jgi:hypothetical protein
VIGTGRNRERTESAQRQGKESEFLHPSTMEPTFGGFQADCRCVEDL